MTTPAAIQTSSARAEGKALLGSNLSADPGAKTEGRAVHPAACLSSSPFGIGTRAINPSRRSREFFMSFKPGDGLLDSANSQQRKLHFTLNQYKSTARRPETLAATDH